MLHLYKAQFYFPFSLKQGTFNSLKNSKHPASHNDFKGEWLSRTPEITPHDPETFAEYQYFHPHTRELLFGAGKSDQPCLMAFEVHEEKIKGWKIDIVSCHRWHTVNLDWVVAHFYDLDVGTLTFGISYCADHGKSQEDIRFDDVLDINNLLRRSGPGFINPEKGPYWSDATKNASELPICVRIVDENGHVPEGGEEDFGESFDTYVVSPDNSDGHTGPVPYPYIGKHFTFWFKHLFHDLKIGSRGEDLIGDLQGGIFHPILDERNFVCSLVAVDNVDTGFGEREFGPCRFGETRNPLGELTTESEKFRKRLYQYVFVDPSTNEYTANNEFRDHCLGQTLYLRFRNRGSYYGFTRYSGVYLCHGADYFSQNILPKHFNSMYFQMANLLIGQRAILLNLSHRAARLSQQATSPGKLENKKLHQKLEDLRSDFLKFHNKYWFSEVTGQEQGIEIFGLWSRNLENNRLFDEVEKEIKALHDFSNATVGRRLGSIAYLNIAMLGLAGPALIASIFGMNLKDIGGGSSEGELLLTIGLYSIPFFSALTLFLIWVGSDIIDCISGVVSCRDKCKTEKGLLPKN